MLVREYFALADNLTDRNLRFTNDLHLLFTGFKEIFKNPFSAAALTILRDYPSLKALQTADMEKLSGIVAKAARRSLTWATNKLEKLFDYVLIAEAIGLTSVFTETKLRIQIQTIEAIEAGMAKIETAIRQQIASNAFPKAVRYSIDLLDAMPGIGFISAVTLIAEIGDFSKFKSAKAFVAFFDIDPAVK